MKYHDLKHHLEKLIVFTLQDIYLLDHDFRQATLYDWEKIGKVVKLKNGVYVFGDFVPNNLDYYLLANVLYKPSYVSTEIVLNHYGIIPEVVTQITCVSTNKTQSFHTSFANFVYQSIQPELFFGYNLLEVREHGVKIATLEKAILDYLYLNSAINTSDDFAALRWNQQLLNETLDRTVLNKYLAIFDNVALAKRIANFYQYLEQ